jgi:hypothetical protein
VTVNIKRISAGDGYRHLMHTVVSGDMARVSGDMAPDISGPPAGTTRTPIIPRGR